MNGYYLIMYCTFKLQREVDLSCPKVSAIVYYYDITLNNFRFTTSVCLHYVLYFIVSYV